MQVRSSPESRSEAVSRVAVVALIPLGIALNLALGTLVHTLRVPIFLDAVGTIAITIVAGLRAGLLVGVLSFLLGGLLVDPVLPWYSGTQALIAVFTHLCARRGWFRSLLTVIPVGIGLGIVAGIASAPVSAWIFGGISGSGQSMITAFFLKTGHNLINSLVLAGVGTEPLDKTIQCLIAVWLIRGVPRSILSRFRRGSLERNGFGCREGDTG